MLHIQTNASHQPRVIECILLIDGGLATMTFLMKTLRNPIFTFLSGLIMTISAISGCGGSGSGSDTSSSSSDDDILNSDLLGVYEATITIGDCDARTATFTLGNDASQIGEGYYIYLAEDGTASYEEDGFTVSRSGRTITVIRSSGLYSLDLTLNFSEDLTTAEITGTFTSTVDTGCSGDVEGTLTLITRTPAEITSGYLQYRTYSDSAANGQVAWLEATKDGLPVSSDDLLSVELYASDVDDGNLAAMASGTESFKTDEYYSGTYNAGTGVLEISEAFESYGGMSMTPASELGQNDYVLVATFAEGDKQYQVRKRISYPGILVSPIISDISCENNESNDLVISWPLPDVTEADSILLTIVKTDNADFIKNLLVIRIDDAGSTSSVTIPAAWMDTVVDLAETIESYGVLSVQAQTLSYTDDGMNYARGYSATVEIEGSVSGTK